ncbi:MULTISPECIES: dipeptide ABC transporter ATP-binding protein [Acidiphilium]|uniref:Peptide/nickel transport system ATP-binding protein n=1 Tax=Acidiphilium rubrum TaxID=526 RepID=A0A8G2FE28_ACIRU|nr:MULTISPECIES: ABC transporter ATP-binding protein [Acidiphilium]SIQ77807.1 peptide/nickel transport system ATP-binding protein [Acidiphilium rubrum]
MSAALTLDQLSVALKRGRGKPIAVLDDINLTVNAGEMTALVGESGSGKTIASLGVIRLLPRSAEVSGRVMLAGTDLTALTESEMRRVRGRDIGMVFQNPLSALNPTTRVGNQIAEVYRLHTGETDRAARARALDLLGEVGIPDPSDRLDDYPHQFSGGMRQRVMIAMALACSPKLLIADEPTTGLDLLVARQILALLSRLRREHRMGVLFITHDLSIVEEHADQVHVLYAGKSVEWGTARSFFAQPRHPYSQALLGAVPRLGQTRLASIPGNLPDPETRPPGCRFAPRCAFREPACETAYPAPETTGGTMFACRRGREINPAAMLDAVLDDPAPIAAPSRGTALEVTKLGVDYERTATSFFQGMIGRKDKMRALSDISFSLRQGECLGIVGQSGSGKSTLGRAVLQMISYQGHVILNGEAFDTMPRQQRKLARRRIQVVFQDPKESMNPRMRIGDIVAEPLKLAGMRGQRARMAQAAALLDRVGLSERMLNLFPGSVSGGQAQRIAIARALATNPGIIVLDEPTSSLDVSTQALLLNLLKDLARQDGLSYMLISHDIAAVSYMADRIAVLNGGAMVEFGTAQDVLTRPTNAYTRELIAASPHFRTNQPGGPTETMEFNPSTVQPSAV